MNHYSEADMTALLKQAYAAFVHGDQQGYDERMERSRQILGKAETDAQRRMLGEWTLLSRLNCMGDAEKTLAVCKRAAALLGGRSRVVDRNRPFNLGSDSMLTWFWQKPGGLDAVSAPLAEAVSLYYDMTGGGLGYDTLFDAEAALFRGDLNAASILAHKTVYVATNTAQPMLAANAAKVLAQIAKHRIDKSGWVYALRTLDQAVERDAATDGASGCRELTALTRLELLTILRDFDALPEWLREGDFFAEPGKGVLGLGYRIDNPNVPYIHYPIALWTHMLYLLLTKQAERVLAADAVAQMYGIPQNILIMRIYCDMARGVCHLGLGDRAAAYRALEDAVELALPDRMWLILGEFCDDTDGIIPELLMAARQPEGLAMVEQISRGLYDKSVIIRQALAGFDAMQQLTAREREVAKLAGEGLRNREIARRLSVTEQTVKFHLSNIYDKLAVNGRNELSHMMRDH